MTAVAQPRLGELLEQWGWVSREQLLRALRHQKVVGGKLGTCLLEIDALSEANLLKALGQQQGLPVAAPDDLRGVPDEVTGLVPAKVARRCHAVPFRAGGTQISVALVDARDLRVLDELAFVTGRRVRAFVTTEIRIFEALEKYYAMECPQRIAKLLDRVNRARFLWEREGVTPAVAPRELLQWDPKVAGAATQAAAATPRRLAAPPESRAPSSSLDLPGFEPAPDIPEPTPARALPIVELPPVEVEPHAAEAPSREDTASDTQEVEPRATPASRLQAEARLAAPGDRDDVARALADALAGIGSRTVVFRAAKDHVVAWQWRGDGLERSRISSFRAGYESPSIFVALRDGGSTFRGVLPPMPVHRELAAAAGAADSSSCLVVPIRLKKRLVAAVWVEPASQEALAATARLAEKASIAFEMCILRAKLERAGSV